MKIMSKIGNGCIMIIEIGSGGGGLLNLGGKVNHVWNAINYGINMKIKNLLFMKMKDKIKSPHYN